MKNRKYRLGFNISSPLDDYLHAHVFCLEARQNLYHTCICITKIGFDGNGDRTSLIHIMVGKTPHI